MINFFKTFLSAVCVSIIACSCHETFPSVSRAKSFSLVKQGEAEINASNFDSASVLIGKAIAIYPENYVAYNDRAYIKIKQNKPPNEIILDLKKALKISPRYTTGTFSLANYYFELKDYKNTIDFSKRYLSFQLSKQLDSGLLQHIYYILAKSEENMLQFDDAIIDFKKSIAINPNDKFSHYDLGECYYYGKTDITNALKEFTYALDIDPTYYQAYIEREKCDRNDKPLLIKQAISDSINSYKYDTTSTMNKSDSMNKVLEKFRKSVNPKIAAADAYYNDISSLDRAVKVLQQKLINTLVADLNALKQNNSFTVNIKYLQKLNDSNLVANAILLKKLNSISEFDATINLKTKLQDYQTNFRNFIVIDLPKFIEILNSSNTDKFTAGMNLFAPDLLLIRNTGIEFKNAEDEFFNKYALH